MPFRRCQRHRQNPFPPGEAFFGHDAGASHPMERRGRRSLRMGINLSVGNGHDRSAVPPGEIGNPPGAKVPASAHLCHSEGRSPVGISWVIVRIPTAYQEIATACGLAMTTGIRGRCLRIRPKFPGEESAYCGTAIAVPYSHLRAGLGSCAELQISARIPALAKSRLRRLLAARACGRSLPTPFGATHPPGDGIFPMPLASVERP